MGTSLNLNNHLVSSFSHIPGLGRNLVLLIAGEKDHTVPSAVVTAEYRLQQHNPGVTEFREIAGRGHSLTIDHGWREVAEIALAFIAQQLQKG